MAARADVRSLAVLVARAQLGDAASLSQLLESLQSPLYDHVRFIVRDEHLAEDVLQDVLYLVARKLTWLRDPRWLRAWAFKVATRQAVRRVRQERQWRDGLQGDELSTFPAPDDELDFDPELVDAIPGWIDGLPPASAVVLRMHYLDGFSFTEIAEALEIPVGTAKSRLAYGLDALRRSIAAKPR